jgi:cell division protein FtsZ
VLVPQTNLRTGTYDASPAVMQAGQAANFAPGSGASVESGFADLQSPSVFRNSRAQAAVQVAALEESGVERLDIPAFLRRQAD